MALVINADDLGKDENINNAIMLAFDRGLIDRTTLMTNMPAAAEGMKTASDKGLADKVGIHINLTSGKPLTEDISKDPLMCGNNGEFNGNFARNMRTRFFFPKKTRRNVEKELRAQLDKYAELGGTLWHVDSHHHVHTDPSVWLVLRKVFADYPVTSVRLGRNMYKGGNPLMRIYKYMLNSSIRRFCKGNPKYFGSARDISSYTENVKEFARKYDVEVMVHPVFDDAGNLCDEYMDRLYELKRPQ